MRLDLNLIRIDPAAHSVVLMKVRIGRNATREVARMLRAPAIDRIGWRVLVEIEDKPRMKPAPDPLNARRMIMVPDGPTPLVAAGVLDLPDETPAWRLRGCESHAGIGLLFGQGGGGGMVDVPVDIEWVNKRILWLPNGEAEE